MAPQLTEPPSIARALEGASQPNEREAERQPLVSSKKFSCVHTVGEGTIARRRGKYVVRRQKRQRSARRSAPSTVSTAVHSNPIPIVPGESDSDPLPRAPMFSPSARGVGFQRVCRFWKNLVQRFEIQFAERQIDIIPAPVPEAQVADSSDDRTESLDLELRLGMPGEPEVVDVPLALSETIIGFSVSDSPGLVDLLL